MYLRKNTKKNFHIQVVECTDHPCSTLPCENHSSCLADEQGFLCDCKPNFVGKNVFFLTLQKVSSVQGFFCFSSKIKVCF